MFDKYFVVISPKLTYLFGLQSGKPSKVRAIAVFPFIIVFRSKEEIVPWVINHERIHHRQQIETLFIGIFLLGVAETLCALLVKRMTLNEAARWRSNEQEAYRNQNDMEYLSRRKPFAFLKYLRDKRMFDITGPGEISHRPEK